MQTFVISSVHTCSFLYICPEYSSSKKSNYSITLEPSKSLSTPLFHCGNLTNAVNSRKTSTRYSRIFFVGVTVYGQVLSFQQTCLLFILSHFREPVRHPVHRLRSNCGECLRPISHATSSEPLNITQLCLRPVSSNPYGIVLRLLGTQSVKTKLKLN